MSLKLINAIGDYHKRSIEKLNDKELTDYVTSRYRLKSEINHLPDSAFAIILPGGKKDKTGRTVPRSLRKFAHHTRYVRNPGDNKTVDLPWLRNTMVRIATSKIPASMKARGERHLRRHAKAILKEVKE